MAKKIRKRIRRIWLFLKIVFRVWNKQGDYVIRLWPKLAWEVAGIIHEDTAVEK